MLHFDVLEHECKEQENANWKESVDINQYQIHVGLDIFTKF